MVYLYLPSNASMGYYPANTLQNYRTRVLLNADETSGNWEVGLVSIIYPGISYNVNATNAKMWVEMTNNHVRGVSIPEGRYSTVEQLVTSITTALNSILPATATQLFELTYDEKLTRKVTYTLVDNPSQPDIPHTGELTWESLHNKDTILGCSFSQRVTEMLGFEDTKDRAVYSSEYYMQHVTQTFTGRYVADLNKGQEPMYVYSDIMEPCPVGDTRSPLLRIIQHNENYAEAASLCHKEFTRIHYHKVKRKNINEIEIDIKDGYGEKIPFDRGTLTVTLHLRRAKSHF